jgi:hypothetical protein
MTPLIVPEDAKFMLQNIDDIVPQREIIRQRV